MRTLVSVKHVVDGNAKMSMNRFDEIDVPN